MMIIIVRAAGNFTSGGNDRTVNIFQPGLTYSKYSFQVDDNVSPTFLGWSNSGFSLCTMIGSGILGVWCHHCPAAQPLYFSIFVLFVGNLLYAYAEAFGTHGIYAILVARLLLGFSGGKF